MPQSGHHRRVLLLSSTAQIRYLDTHVELAGFGHAANMTDDLSVLEQALRALPLPYSLALRLRDAGVAPDVVCEYLDVQLESLGGFYRIAEEKLQAALTRV